jgi:hypothetical protein
MLKKLFPVVGVLALALAMAALSMSRNDTRRVYAESATAVSAGSYHTCALTNDAGLQCWGSLGQYLSSLVPAPATGFIAVSGRGDEVTAGGYHTCALTTSGGVKCWGYNAYGQLGDGTTINHLMPADVSGLTSGVLAIGVGAFHTCALTTAGGVKCWGVNSAGELGNGSSTGPEHCTSFAFACSTTPVDVTDLNSGVATLAVGAHHACALTTSGVKCWGGNGHGQLGDGTTDNHDTPVSATGLANGVAAVTAGGYHTCARMTSGSVKCWGYSVFGQLGDGSTDFLPHPTPTDVVGLTGSVAAVSAGAYHTCAVTTGGGVKCWGSNGFGQLGDGTTTNQLTPVDVSGLTSGMTAVTAGASHSCALSSTGAVKCWGWNVFGQLGDGTTTANLTPVDVVGFTGAAPTATETATPTPTPAPETTGPVPVDQGGGTVNTGTTPTASDPLETSVTVPAGTSGGTVTVSEGPVTASQAGFTLVGQQVVITTDITGTTASNPLMTVFNLDASVITAGQSQNTVAIFKDATLVPNCLIFPGSTVADHDPCVSNRELLAGEDIRITVLTTTASTWNFGVAATPPPTPTATPAGPGWGDVDCSGSVTIGDAQKIARFLIGLAISQGPDCPLLGTLLQIAGADHTWGDIDCLNGLTIGDAQKIARLLINLAVNQGEGCPQIGEAT